VRNRAPVLRVDHGLGGGDLAGRIDAELARPLRAYRNGNFRRVHSCALGLGEGLAEGRLIGAGGNVDLAGYGNDAVTQRYVRIQTGHF
jgi:hypothetical protein